MNKAQSADTVPTASQKDVSPCLSLPRLSPFDAEVWRLRQEGVHVHRVRVDVNAAEQQRQAMVIGVARLTSDRARRWYWRACAIDDWYAGTHEMSEQALRRDLDRRGEFPRWADFERATITQPLIELHAHTDFRVRYQVQRRGSKIVAVCFHLEKETKAGEDAKCVL